MYSRSLKAVKNYLKDIKHNWGSLVVLFLPFALVFPPVLKFITSNVYWSSITVMFFIIGWIQSIVNTSNNIELKKSLEKANVTNENLQNSLQSVPERITKSLYNYLEFSYSERITIYRFNDTHFVPVGRYALREDYKKSGRLKYKKEEGYIGKAWREGKHYVSNLPDPETNPDEYFSKSTKYVEIDRNTLAEMPMKSRCYYCINLLIMGDPKAVIVFESTSPRFPISIDKINELLESPFGQLLTSTIDSNLPFREE
ncbi:hypothetical protein L8C07_05180 [Paenibacillus sp. CMAA1739]|uniref:hypothetical protein n=1 Tax=Paenibacillus ottowii TaxID=2315729 RepID=UPI002DBA7E05|nr:hypothetical protein [Paenibacillus sp. CMAA1739]MEC4565329.1 hypothetical protein [Paenibacillus sp. CMAA1739]